MKKRIRYDRLFILGIITGTITFLILLLILFFTIDLIVKDDGQAALERPSSTLKVESINYTSEEQTFEEDLDKQEYNGKLCGLETVTCKNEEAKTDLDIIKEISTKYEVDWKLVYAIALHETGRFTSENYLKLNNPGGWQYWSDEYKTMILYSFNSIEEGYEFMISTLKNKYINTGLITIEEIGKIYCPVGINDNGNNKDWIPDVTEIYESLEV